MSISIKLIEKSGVQLFTIMGLLNDFKKSMQIISSIGYKNIELFGPYPFSSDKTKKEWLWQYKYLPTYKSFCYLVKYQNKIIGYYHVPTFKFHFEKKVFLIGNVQDVGILKEYRSLGIFKSLSKYAIKDLSKKVDLLYTFPNKYSIKNFTLNNNFTFFRYLPIFIKQTFSFLFFHF